MPNNILISTGVSQIDGDKLELLGLESSFRRLRATFESSAPIDERAYLERPEVQSMVTAFIEKLLTYYPDIANWLEPPPAGPRRVSPFGAEIASLAALERRQEQPWNPAQDRLVLLASQTRPGLFCRQVLQRALLDLWGVPEASIQTVLVEGLTERPADVGKALTSFVIHLLGELRKADDQISWNNILLGTGGYKSTMTCLTSLAIFYGIELVYLHEDSVELQVLFPGLDLADEQNRLFWRNTWQKMWEMGYAQDSPEWFRLILKGRLEDPVARYAY